MKDENVKYEKISLISIAFLILLMVSSLLLSSCQIPNIEVYIFTDLNECSNIKDLTYSAEKIREYENPNGDKYLKELVYTDFYAASYESEELSFEIFAYEFDSAESAQKYFNNVTGKNVSLDTNFSSSKGMGEFRLVVIDQKYAYTVTSSSKEAEILKKSLCEIFSKNIT